MLIWMRKNRELYLSIGSNLGDRSANLMQAIELLNRYFGTRYKRVSSIIKTPAWGFEGAEFMNLAVAFDTDLEAEDILALCKKVEKEMGRVEEGIVSDSSGKRIYKDRIIDIDIILLGNEIINTEKLIIPHPRMKERDFVMIPLKEIISDEYVCGID